MMERLRSGFAELTAGADLRLIRVAVAGLAGLALGVGGVLLHGAAWWLGIAAVGALLAVGAVVALDDARRQAAADVAARAAVPAKPAAHEPVFAARTALAMPAPPEPLALQPNRTYPQSLRALLEADAVVLPPGHVWPDTSRIRGSLAVRAQMAARLLIPGPVEATGADAPLYVTYAAAGDVATGLHVSALGFRATPVVALLDASVHPGLSPLERQQVDDAVTRGWSSVLGGCVTPPPVLQLLTQLAADTGGPGGAYVLELLEQWRVALRGGRGLAVAWRTWAEARSHVASEAVRMGWTPDQRATADVLLDWLLIQRAAAEDVATAERDRGPGESRGDALQRLDAGAGFAFERVVAELLNAKTVARHAPEAARAAGTALGQETAAPAAVRAA
jgi:hypothetical protein